MGRDEANLGLPPSPWGNQGDGGVRPWAGNHLRACKDHSHSGLCDIGRKMEERDTYWMEERDTYWQEYDEQHGAAKALHFHGVDCATISLKKKEHEWHDHANGDAVKKALNAFTDNIGK
jgi:hypothetical protein